MPVVELDAASLDRPISVSSSETSDSTNSSASNDEANSNVMDGDGSPTYSSSVASYSDSSSPDSDDESNESLGSSNNSFKLLDKIKQTSNKLNMKFLRRGRKKDVNTWKQTNCGDISEPHKGEDRTFATLTETFSSQDVSEMDRSLPMITGPIPFESKDEIDPSYYDLDGQYDDFEWTAVAVPKGFKRVESTDTGLDAQIALTSPCAYRVTEMMARFGVDGSSMASPGFNSDNSSDFGEEESRDVSLLDTDGEQSRSDNNESDDENYSEGDSIVSDGSVEEYTELDALAALAGAVYQIGSCNYKGILDGYDDDIDSLGSDDVIENNQQRRGRSRIPRTPPSDFNLFQQSKKFFGFVDKKSAKSTGSQGGNKTFLQSMFSSYVHS